MHLNALTSSSCSFSITPKRSHFVFCSDNKRFCFTDHFSSTAFRGFLTRVSSNSIFSLRFSQLCIFSSSSSFAEENSDPPFWRRTFWISYSVSNFFSSLRSKTNYNLLDIYFDMLDFYYTWLIYRWKISYHQMFIVLFPDEDLCVSNEKWGRIRTSEISLRCEWWVKEHKKP